MAKKRIITEEETIGDENKTIITELELDRDLDYFRTLYSDPDGELICKLYRLPEQLNGKRLFLFTYDYVPDEMIIGNSFGGGEYEMFFLKREGKKGGQVLKDKARIYIDKAAFDKVLLKEIPVSNNGNVNGLSKTKDLLEEVKLYKEVLSGGQNNNDNSVMMQMMTIMSTMLIEMMKANSGGGDSKLLETILPTLLNKSLDKGNILSDLETIGKIKEMFPGEGGGSDWGSIIANTLPVILQMANQPKQIPSGRVRPGNIPAPVSNNIPFDPNSMKELMKQAVREVDQEYDNSQNSNPTDDEVIETNEFVDDEGNVNSESANNKIKNNEIDMNIASQVKLIKNAPKAAQDNVLKLWCGMKPIAEVLDFCVDTELVKDAQEFIERCKSMGIDTSSIEEPEILT